MKKNNLPSKPSDTDIDFTGMHLSEITDAFNTPGGEEEIVNEQEQSEIVNEEEENQTTNKE